MHKKKTIRFMLVRHGISTSNLEHRLVGWEDVDLSPEGIAQLKEYKNTVKYLDVDRFYCSDLLRARKTFDLLFSDQYQIYRTEKGLREVHFGFFDGATQAENQKHDYYNKWLENIRQQDEETIVDFIERVNLTFKEIALECLHDDIEKVGIVLHEGSIKCILMNLLNIEHRCYPLIRFGNGLGIIIDVEVSEDELKLVRKEYIRKPGSFNLSVVRHGISKANDENRFVGWTDVPLAKSGIEELKRYRNMIQYPDVERYYCSDLLRAKQTYEILFGDQGKECIYTEGFRENYYGSYEDIPTGPKVREYFELWIKQVDLGGEEKLPAFQNRIAKALHEAINQSIHDGLNSCGIVAHAGVLKIIYLHLANKQLKKWGDIRVQNGLGFNFYLEIIDGTPKIITSDLI